MPTTRGTKARTSTANGNDCSVRSLDKEEVSDGGTSHVRGSLGRCGIKRVVSDESDEPVREQVEKPVREQVENELEEEEDSATRFIGTYSIVMTIILVCCALGWMRDVVFQRTIVFVFAVTAWIFPSYYCQVLQEYLDDPANEDQRFIWSRIGFCIHRIMGHDSRQFFGRTHGEPTDWSRAISCFCVNVFLANAAYLLSTVWIGDEKDVGILYELSLIHI